VRRHVPLHTRPLAPIRFEVARPGIDMAFLSFWLVVLVALGIFWFEIFKMVGAWL
jgi:hypothetical protein